MTNRRPNILLIITDDQQFDALGAMGNRQVRTPELDRLATEGVLCRRAAILGGDQAAVCCPSRAMIHTGRSLYRTGLSPEGHLTGKFPTLAETFRAAGYRTFATGKQHNGPLPVARGFTDADQLLFAGMSHHMRLEAQGFDPEGAYDQGRTHMIHRFSSEQFTDAALEFLEQRHSDKAPFLLYLAYTVPHDPIMAPPEFMAAYDPEEIILPSTFQPQHPFDRSPFGDRVRKMQSCDECTADAVVKFHEWPIDAAAMRQLTAGYYAMLSHLDAQIGRLRRRLEEQGEWERTVVVFTSDNGIAMGRHGCYHKQTSYDHDAHVPLILAGPGLPRAQYLDDLVLLIDLYPTLCGLAGLSTPATVEGRSLLPRLGGDPLPHRSELYHSYRQAWRAVHDGRFRYLVYAGPDESGVDTVQELLFDLHSDPHEADDLAKDPVSSATRVRLRQQLICLRDEHSDPLLPGGFWERVATARGG